MTLPYRSGVFELFKFRFIERIIRPEKSFLR